MCGGLLRTAVQGLSEIAYVCTVHCLQSIKVLRKICFDLLCFGDMLCMYSACLLERSGS